MDNSTQSLERDAHFLLSEKYHNEPTHDFYSDLEELRKGVPLDYVIGNRPFLGCSIDLSHKPLIPRTETEFWVERAIQYIRERNTPETSLPILDIFSGSGCIGIAIAKHIPTACVDFAEIDPTLVLQIERNIKDNTIENHRVQIFLSDCFANIPEKKYRYIFANPPYISKNRISVVQTSVMAHEPHRALFADDDGAYYIKKLITEGQKYLLETGVMFIEMDPHQKEMILEYTRHLPCVISFWNDQFTNTRVAVVSYL